MTTEVLEEWLQAISELLKMEAKNQNIHRELQLKLNKLFLQRDVAVL